MDITTTEGRQELGTRIQSAVMAAGFDSLPEFARRVGWSRALIYQYVSGSVLVQLDRLQQIATQTGKPLEWFLAAAPNADATRAAELATRVAESTSRLNALQEELAGERGARLESEAHCRQAELKLLGDYCQALRRIGDAPGLVEAAARWLELARQAGDEEAGMRAHLQMGHGWFLQGQLARAEQVLAEAITAAVALGQTATLYSARQERVRALLQAGRVPEARREAEALAAADLWWPRWSGRILLAAIATQAAQPDEAAAHLQAAQETIATADEPAARRALATAYLLSNRTTLALVCGDYPLAARLNDELRSLAAQAGAVDQLREAELNRAMVALRRGDTAATAEGLQRLEEWAALVGDARMRVLSLIVRSELHRRCGEFEQARGAARTALEQAAELNQAHLLAEAELALGHVYHAEGRTDDATYHLRRGARMAAEHRLVRLELQARLLLLALAVQQDSTAAASWPGLIQELHEHGLTDLEVEAHVSAAPALAPDVAALALHRAAETAARIDYFWGAHAAVVALGRLRLAAGDTAGVGEALAHAAELRADHPGAVACGVLIRAEDDLRDRGSTRRPRPRRRALEEPS